MAELWRGEERLKQTGRICNYQESGEPVFFVDTTYSHTYNFASAIDGF